MTWWMHVTEPDPRSRAQQRRPGAGCHVGGAVPLSKRVYDGICTYIYICHIGVYT